MRPTFHLSPVTIRAEYDRQAADYDRRWARYNRASLELLPLERMERDLGRVLDVGCGTGNVLPFLARAGFRIQEYVGVDLSPQMLRVGLEKANGAAARARFAAADAGRLPLRDGSFDTAISASALHYWDDADSGLAQIRRVLRPGGHLLLLDWVRDPLPMRLLNAWMRITRVRYRRMYSRSELRAALARVGFDVRMEVRGSAGGLWRLIAFEAQAV